MSNVRVPMNASQNNPKTQDAESGEGRGNSRLPELAPVYLDTPDQYNQKQNGINIQLFFRRSLTRPQNLFPECFR